LTAERGLNVRRVSAQKEAFPDDHAPALENNFERLTALLKKEKALPRKRKGLDGKVKSWFQQLSAEERSELTQRLFHDGFVSESDKSLTFVSARFRGA
jgi:hypothetical protein